MSKFTLGQRQFPTLGLRSQQPKNYVGPTLSCYLGHGIRLFILKTNRPAKISSLIVLYNKNDNKTIQICAKYP